MRKLVLTLIFSTALASAEIGIGLRASLISFNDLQRQLNQFNREWGGNRNLQVGPPLWGLELFALGVPGPARFGAGGGLAFRSLSCDSLRAELAGLHAGLETGYPLPLTSFLTVEPGLGIGINSFFLIMHSLEPGMSNFNRWLFAWDFNLRPGILALLCFPFGAGGIQGLYVQGGYTLPLGIPQRYGSLSNLSLSLRGWMFECGLLLGKTTPRPLRI
ncbi:MAG: hypothetical protein N2248_05545 [candidate division WOR-3 bacterium]|uniref:Uncharacterized protein n=1 Tax=candidate division WOR-3 bacterium TaxID=2052148 RepID=A0A7C1SD52_UNCW3|nr:hypothetical protein [candidate division WOR-3 bacterium]